MTELLSLQYVLTGEVKVEKNKGILTSSPLGSCVAVVAYDKLLKVAGIAHVMLPGKSNNDVVNNKYAVDAVESLLMKFTELGSDIENVNICLVGGANVLKKEKETIHIDVVNSVLEVVKEKNLNIAKKSLGGLKRRSVSINIEIGVSNFSIGDEDDNILCDFNVVNR